MKTFTSLFISLFVSLLVSGCAINDQLNTHNSNDDDEDSELFAYQCGGIPLMVTIDKKPAQARILIDGQLRALPQVVSASGAKYSDGLYDFWSKGDQASLNKGESAIFDDCKLFN